MNDSTQSGQLKAHADDPLRIAFVGDYLPRKCGIATFTHSLREAIQTQYPETNCIVVSVNDRRQGYDYSEEVHFEFYENELDSYHRAAEYLNYGNFDVVSLQHEFGLFGGQGGDYIIELLQQLRMPVITTLHTVLESPDDTQRYILQRIAGLSDRLVVMTQRGRRMLQQFYNIPLDKIDVIPHGIPDVPFVDSAFYKDVFGVDGKQVLLTFGLLSPNKGIEVMLKAMPKVISEFPNVIYIILGATHPNLVKSEGEAYRTRLERLAQDLGIERQVSFYNKFVSLEELKEFICSADIYVTPYINAAQITSGTLAYAFGCGKAVVSTPYWHASELLADNRGVLVPFNDADGLAKGLVGLLRDEKGRNAIRKRAYLEGRQMIWSKVADRYNEAFVKARRIHGTSIGNQINVQTLEGRPLTLPCLRLDHVRQLSDSTGILQHAILSFPNLSHGYCTDDNARALIVAVLFEHLEDDTTANLGDLKTKYASFLNYAFNLERRRFRHLMAFDGRWLDALGSDDSQGRVIWALGTCVGRSRNSELRAWAAHLLELALESLMEMTSPRGWSYALLGIHEYFRRMSGDRIASQVREGLTQKLIDLYDANASPDWQWFEPILTYDNARLCQALILSGRWSDNVKASKIGLSSLNWLCQQQVGSYFRPVGTNGFYRKGEKREEFDQQPIEAQATIGACSEAFRVTSDTFWHKHAHLAFEWYLGRNHLGLPLYNSATGGCKDGLQVDRINENQGAESTLSFLLSFAEICDLENNHSWKNFSCV